MTDIFLAPGSVLDGELVITVGLNVSQGGAQALSTGQKIVDQIERMLVMDLDKIDADIKVGGLHRVKAKRIKEILQRVRRERGAFDLDYLRKLDMNDARAELGKYKGVGAKSINCILLFSLGLPAFPVDTHVHRILRRLGIVATKDLSKANRDSQELDRKSVV